MLNRLRTLLRGGQALVLEYPVRSTPRYGFGRPAHRALRELLEAQRTSYRRTLESFLPLQARLAEIPHAPGVRMPGWRNGFLPGLDAVSLYALLALRRPQQLVEIGSGNSTQFARRAIEVHGLDTRITSIDPEPRREIDALSDRVIRRGLEDTDLEVFASLQPGDFVFMDGSHRCFMNSDVAVFFLDVLPALPAGVLVQIHDIWLPFDYPVEWIPRYYSEQYLLATHLLARGRAARVLLPNYFVSLDPELGQILAPLWDQLGDVERHGHSFWLETAA